MPSQDKTSGIPVSHAPDGVGYRLLELPPELVQSDEPWSLESDPSGLARLRTSQGKLYTLRQKNTSNALVLLSATNAASEDASSPGLAAVATLHETVELVEDKGAAPKGGAAKAGEGKSDGGSGGDSSQAQPAADAGKSAAAPPKGRWHEKFGRTR